MKGRWCETSLDPVVASSAMRQEAPTFLTYTFSITLQKDAAFVVLIVLASQSNDSAKMGVNMNVFRVLGDLSHAASKCILIWAIHSNKSAEGVSLLTQLLYILVFGTRYLDLFWVPPWWSLWNTVFKIFYIGSSAYIVWVMMRVYARTREKEYAWKLATWSLAGSLVIAPIVVLIFRKLKNVTFIEVRKYHMELGYTQLTTITNRCSGASVSSSKASASSHNSCSFARPPCPPFSTATISSSWAATAPCTFSIG